MRHNHRPFRPVYTRKIGLEIKQNVHNLKCEYTLAKTHNELNARVDNNNRKEIDCLSMIVPVSLHKVDVVIDRERDRVRETEIESKREEERRDRDRKRHFFS